MTIEEKVQNGLKYLDEHFDDWIDTFREEEPDINIGSSNLHVVARITGIDYNLSLRTLYDTNEEQKLFDWGFAGSDEEIEELNEEWINQILIRKMQNELKTKDIQVWVKEQESQNPIQGDLFNGS